jgi:hypothetical protein
MAGRKDRNYDEILKGCKDFAEAVAGARARAALLGREASVAESTLKDRVATKNINAIKELGETILRVTSQGEERVRELEQKVKTEKSRFEELER